MKRIYTKMALLAVAGLTTLGASAQSYLEDPKWGDNPENRKQNVLEYNYFSEQYNNQNYDQALVYFRNLIKNAPKASQNIYINGANIYKNKIARSTALAEKKLYVDTLMMVYDLRAEHFGDHATRGRGYILQNKAREYLTFNPADRDGVMKYFKEAVDASEGDLDPNFINIYFQELTNDYKNDNIGAEEFMDIYSVLEKYMIASGDEAAKETFEALFITSGAADCTNLEKMFSSRLAESPDDKETLAKAFGLMANAKCSSDFFFSVGEKYYQLEPSSNTALLLAGGFEEKKDFEKALKYLNEAIASESEPDMKEKLCLRVASSQLGLGNARSAADFAKQAIDINPESGLAYYLLAQAYATGASSCSDFARSSVYWLVYDTLAKARPLLTDDEDMAKQAETQMATYRGYFPAKEECFFRGLTDGSSYTVSCGWISGTTVVRSSGR